MRIPLLAGNWKMHKTIEEARNMVQELVPQVAGLKDREVVVCPPFTALALLQDLLMETGIGLGGQNMHPAKEGAFTGEISGPMLKEAGCSHVIIGHSERRQYLCETNEGVDEKVVSALGAGLTPIVCVGETLQEREDGRTEIVIKEQIANGLKSLPGEQLEKIIIAYEPVWAIGTGKTASADDAQQVCSFIRKQLALLKPGFEEKANQVRILYGGSVKPDNVKELMAQKDIDGALVGGASLQADTFAKIVRFEEQ